MVNTLRIRDVQINNSSNINVTFTENLTPNLVTSNVTIISDTPNIPESQVLKIKIRDNQLSIYCQPLTELAAYFIIFQSTTQNPFISVNGTARIVEDGITNKFLITGPLSSENPVKNYLKSFLLDNIYDVESDNTIVSQHIKSLSVMLARALYDIRQVKNENYLSFSTIDEQKTRGTGPSDRLNEEGAYEIIRVGRTPTGTNVSKTFVFDEFPTEPVTLQRETHIETLTADSSDEVGKFNINSLIFNLGSSPVTKLNSISFVLATATPNYEYNIETLGYQIKDSRYDQEFGFSYLLLEDNQIKISDEILDDPLFALDSILSINISYESKGLGIVIDPTTVAVYSVQDVIRETLPPIINIFSLAHAPVVDANNEIPDLDGVTFTDPNSNIAGALHPAFEIEIPFRLNALPATPGVYAIDYPNSTVYVYGEDSTNSGTGPYPPLATYKYRYTYKTDLDYVYDASLVDLVALPNGSLVDFPGTIAFDYEKVLIPEIDYKAGLHQEELSERIDNRLVALNALKTINSPITNVFRIYNETSGEIYTLDRWNDDKIYFRTNNPPRLNSITGERVSFSDVPNELLFVDTTLINASELRVFNIPLDNNSIIASTEDSLAASFNTSLVFVKSNIFVSEIWYNRDLSVDVNIDKLTAVGEYMVDYANGIIYCAVSSTQDFSLGTVTYKNNVIDPIFPHVVSVEDIYYRISVLNPKNKLFTYIDFEDGAITPEIPDPADELFLNASDDAPYQLSDSSIGAFVDAVFVPGVTHQIKFIRSVFEYEDISNSTHPLDFSTVSTPDGFNITVSSINKETFESVQFDDDTLEYYVNVNENIPYISDNITYTFSVVRTSDLAELWNGSGTIVPGSTLKLVLPGISSPQEGDLVRIVYDFSINDLSRLVIDYNKGDFFTDYTYVADEIIVSYEYGDNVLDFRTGQTLSPGDSYYVSYKSGALRDALLKNFGTLVNIPELTNFDIDFDRERYRDSLMAALTSFIQGPTLTAIKNIGKTISHIQPEVTESVFENWSLGNSLLYPESVTTTGEFELLSGKFGNGVLVNADDQTITFPVNSNLRFEEGTFETWIIPQWDGLDNDANLTFTILRDGYAIDPYKVFIGASESHPEITDGVFSLNKSSSVIGRPNTNKDGVFIYYDQDSSGDFYRWFVEIEDGYVDGYMDGYAADYRFTITTDGKFYDAKSITTPKPSNMQTFTGTNRITMIITGGTQIEEGITFIADPDHYILDFGKSVDQSRLSLFKDSSGYINFRVFDQDRTNYSVSADVSSWKAGEQHHVAISWKLNTRNNRDEMHLFIDGFEVPNIIKYGQNLQPYLHQKYKTVTKEDVAGLAARDIIGSIDLATTAGSSVVSSSINFSAYNIFAGDTIFIDETGFDESGYTIAIVNGQSLTLTDVMPATLTDGRFSVNRTEYTITSDIDVAPNTAVYTIHSLLDNTDLDITLDSDQVSSASVNFENEGVEPGYLISIDDPSLDIVYTILAVSGNTLTINDDMPATLSGLTFIIYEGTENELPGTRALRPDYSITKDDDFNNILTLSNDVFAKDLVVVKTLGLNHRRIKKQYYIWSNDAENILMTRLPPPISLDEARITKIILSPTAIGPSNSTFTTGFQSENFPVSQPTSSISGRFLTATITGTNTDFTTPATVTIDGISNMVPTVETLSFTDYGSQDTINQFTYIDNISSFVVPVNSARNALNVEVKEMYPVTFADGYTDGYAPVIRFSYHIGGGYTLQRDGDDSVRDEGTTFSGLDINNYLWVHTPPTVAGFYLITGLSEDRQSLTVTPTNAVATIPLPAFTGGSYQILKVSDYRSGLQNGFFTFEYGDQPGQPYYLNQGFYELDYFTYARIKFDALNGHVYLGSDFAGIKQVNAILDQVKIYSIMLTDTRTGETTLASQRSITRDFNSLKPLLPDTTSLMMLDFETFPFTNGARFYSNKNTDKQHFQSSSSVNDNFGNGLVILDKPITIPNEGILDTKKQATIEFWLNPIYDTGNDPNTRVYFDAFGAVIEEAVSVDKVSVKISSPASSILSVKLKGGDQSVDYFAGGRLEIDTQNAIQEEALSTTANSVMVAKSILQVITVKIEGDLTDTDYFAEGSINTDLKTIYLGRTLPSSTLPLIVTYQTTENKKVKQNTQVIRLNRELPHQNTHVVVNYIPKGLQGDRISIFKDISGYMNFAINASESSFVLRAPILWSKNTWHRVKASYKINSGNGTDEMRLFLDGYEFTNIQFGIGTVFGDFPFVMGSSMPGDGYNVVGNISFEDPINDLFIGSSYAGTNPIYSIIDNFRISNISRPIYAPYGESLDVNYSNNLDTVFPVTEDLYTTYLLDFSELIELETDFALLKNRNTGLFDFSVNILDSFGIVNSSLKVQEVLEKLIKVLKPANSRVFIQYTR